MRVGTLNDATERDHLFADDCALIASTEAEMCRSVDLFA